MLKVTSYSQIVQVDRYQDFSTSDGMPGIDLQINDNMDFLNRFTEMENKVMLLEAEHLREQALIAKHPAIKDAHEQYKMLVKLAIENEKTKEDPAP